MANQNTDSATIGMDRATITSPGAPRRLQALAASAKPLYTNFLLRLSSLHSAQKPVSSSPVAPPISPKIVKSFTSLGSTGFLGAPAEIDDRQKIFRDGMLFMASSTKDKKKLNESTVSLLHNPQRTPATNFLASRSQVTGKQYPFARRSENAASLSTLPAITRVFDELLASPRHFEHPNGINGVCAALASIISLCLVRVHEAHPDFNEASPYLDLSPLYGANDSESQLVRAMDGRGMLSPDCFYDDRVMFHSPAVAVLLILWNRNHNYIARHLLLNNEGKKWVDPMERESPDAFLAQDNEIFRIAKDINCVQFKNVVVEDFMKILAGVPHIGPGPSLDILTVSSLHLCYVVDNLLSFQHLKQSEKGKGHESTIELRRNSDARFRDEDLARVLQDATEQAAGAAGARTVPIPFRPVELVALERARNWRVGTLNEFRKFLGLRPLKDFADWHPDPDVASAAEQLYGSIDALELYPGLQGEAVLENSGLSLGYTLTYALLVDLVTLIRSDPKFTTDFTPGKLTHWGIKDCVTLTENGGFNTWLPKLLQRNLPRNYPYDNIYSVFPLSCPATTRDILNAQTEISGLYSYERPMIQTIRTLDTKQAISHVFNNAKTYPTIYGRDLKTLSNGYGFLLGFDDEKLHDRELMMALFALIPDKGALVRYSEFFGRTAAGLIREKAIRTNGENTMSVDIVRDVINATCTRWVCATLCGLPLSGDGDQVNARHEEFGALYGYIFRNVDPEHGWAIRKRAIEAARTLEGQIKKILPIPKTKANPTFKEMIEDNVNDFVAYLNRLRLEISDKGIELPQFSALTFLNRLVKSNRTQAFRLGEMVTEGHLKSLTTLSPDQMINEIAVREERLEESRVLANILGLAVVTSVNYAQPVDFYLHEDRVKEHNEIIRLSSLSPAEARKIGANATIMGYIREAQRLTAASGLWRDVAEDDLIPQGHELPPVAVRKGERVFADFSTAHTDAREIERPFDVDPKRKVPSLLGMGLHKCPAGGFIDQTMPELFKAIFKLKGLRRDTGRSGRLEQIVCHPAPLKFDADSIEDSGSGLEVNGAPGAERRAFFLLAFFSVASNKLRKRTRKWATNFGKKTDKLRESMDRIIKLVAAVLIALELLYLILSLASSMLSFFNRPLSRRPILDSDIQRDNSTCRTPTTLIHPYEIYAFAPGPDGVNPKPLEYNLDSPKYHRLSIVSIGNRDLRMGVYVDDTLRGMTSRIVRNSSESCGEVVNDCLAKKFSAGVVVVPPGSHTIRIEWASNGFAPNTTNEADTELDWVAHPDRRFKWKREYCA
ncbi:hypothetical protein H0H87_012895 [Tephrocybe sp. NHM501043]|nr:hypothetical protein H0H87_012895 [Tephrocybe sp. NHM501043]